MAKEKEKGFFEFEFITSQPGAKVNFLLDLVHSEVLPTNITIKIEFGDSKTKTMLVEKWPLLVPHSYSSGIIGNLTPNVSWSNYVSGGNKSSELMIQEIITGMEFHKLTAFYKVDDSVEVEIVVLYGSHIDFEIDFGVPEDTTDAYSLHYSQVAIDRKHVSFHHSYEQAGTFVVCATAKNDVSDLNISQAITIENDVGLIQLAPVAAVGFPIGVAQINLKFDPSLGPFRSVSVFLDWGDDGIEEPDISDLSLSWSRSHEYSSIQKYIVNLTLLNQVSRNTLLGEVVVQNIIQGLSFSAELAECGSCTVDFKVDNNIRFIASKNSGSDVTYKWNFDSEQSNEIIPSKLNEISHSYNFPKQYLVSLTAENMVSNETFTKHILVIIDIDFIQGFSILSEVIIMDLWKLSIVLSKQEDNVCFETFIQCNQASNNVLLWKGTSEAVCRDGTTYSQQFDSAHFHALAQDQTEIYFVHMFPSGEEGKHNVTVTVMTDSLTQSMGSQVRVDPLPCEAPKIEPLNIGAGASPEKPHKILKSASVTLKQSFFKISLNCPATDHVDWKWSLDKMEETDSDSAKTIYVSQDLGILKTRQYQDTFTIFELQLQEGMYRCSYHLKMLGYPDRKSIGTQYFIVNGSPLKVEIAGGSLLQKFWKQVIWISALPHTYDPDDKGNPSDAKDVSSKLHLSWACLLETESDTLRKIPWDSMNNITLLTETSGI